MKYKMKLINRIQKDVWIYTHHFSGQKQKSIFENAWFEYDFTNG